jgi:hypothetical protein
VRLSCVYRNQPNPPPDFSASPPVHLQVIMSSGNAERAAIAYLGHAANVVRVFSLLCQFNSNHRFVDANHTTIFHSASEPPISLALYLARLAKYTGCGPEGVVLGIRLAGRYCRRTRMLPSVLNAHRLLLAATVLVQKVHVDVFASNKTAASVGGVDVKELGELETALFRGVDYQIMMRPAEIDTMQRACDEIVKELRAAPFNHQLAAEAFGLTSGSHLARVQACQTATSTTGNGGIDLSFSRDAMPSDDPSPTSSHAANSPGNNSSSAWTTTGTAKAEMAASSSKPNVNNSISSGSAMRLIRQQRREAMYMTSP